MCVDVEEGKVGRDQSVVDMFTLIMSSQQEPLSQQSAHLTAKLIQSLAIPGRKKKLGNKPQLISPGNNFLMLYLLILIDSTCTSINFSHGVWGFEFGWLVVRTIYVAYDPNDAFLI